MNTPSAQIPPSQLRQQVRKKRRQLSSLQQRLAAKRILQKLIHQSAFKAARHIAFYAAIDGELDVSLILEHALSKGKRCYMPSVISGSRELHFFRLDTQTQLRKGAFNILHAPHRHRLEKQQLDLVLMPLVAFDEQGTRMGMGGGYYDFTFRHLDKRPFRRTRLIGLAHRCQQVKELQENTWDIKPDRIFAV